MRTSLLTISISVLMVGAPPNQDVDSTTSSKRIAWADEPDVLMGITAVNLHVVVRGDVKNVKAGETALREQIEKRLRKAGLKVLTNDEVANEEVPVMLTVIVECRAIRREGSENASPCDGGMFLVTVQLDDVVVPYRAPETVILGAITWSRRRFGHATTSSLPRRSVEETLDVIDHFCRGIQVN